MYKKMTHLLSLALLASMLGAPAAQAALRAVGPINPVTTLPAWFQDNLSLSLALCLDQQPLTPGVPGPCILTPNFDPDPAAAPLREPPNAPLSTITTTGPIDDTNFPDESFWWIADNLILGVGQTGAGRITFRYALEAAFLGAGPVVAPNTGISFLRLNLGPVSDLLPGATYTVTHPFGSFQITADGTGVAPRFRLRTRSRPHRPTRAPSSPPQTPISGRS